MIENFKHASFNLANGELISFVSSDDFLINSSFISDAVQAFLLYLLENTLGRHHEQ